MQEQRYIQHLSSYTLDTICRYVSQISIIFICHLYLPTLLSYLRYFIKPYLSPLLRKFMEAKICICAIQFFLIKIHSGQSGRLPGERRLQVARDLGLQQPRRGHQVAWLHPQGRHTKLHCPRPEQQVPS